MTQPPLGVHVSFCGALLFVAACHHKHHRPRHDASTDPVEAAPDAGAGLGGFDAGGRLVLAAAAEFNACPRPSLLVTPIRTPLDQPIVVSSMSVDPDGDSLGYAWTAEPDGDFDEGAEQVAYYNCASLGPKTLHLSVVDARGCEAHDWVEIDCVGAP